MNHTFSLTDKMIINKISKKVFKVKIFTLIFFFLVSCSLWSQSKYRVVIDPGHGGYSKPFDDKWDPIEKKYLEKYNGGMNYENHYEYKIVFEISKKVYKYLKLTQSESTWNQFVKLIKEFSDVKDPKRIVIETYLSRDKNWDDLKIDEKDPNLNNLFRLYDFPLNGKMEMGRISKINSYRPHLVVSIHLNSGGFGHKGGMAAVLAPGYKTFQILREITIEKRPKKDFYRLPWSQYWMVNMPGWSKLEMALSDTWVYFHGFRRNNKTNEPWQNVGLRHNMIQWRYKDPDDWIEKAIEQRKNHLRGSYSLDYKKFNPEGKFWEREKGELEYFRRERAIPYLGIKFGGDNHYATDEILRFIQFGIRTQHPELVKRNMISGIVDPFVSTYALPTYVNAVCAYLEVAHLDVGRDRFLVLNYQDTIAKSIAVGIYSLFVGLKVKKGKVPFKPRGVNVDFKKYMNHKEGNYFEKVVE